MKRLVRSFPSRASTCFPNTPFQVPVVFTHVLAQHRQHTGKMPPTTGLGLVGMVFEEFFQTANQHFYDGEFDEGNAAARSLLLGPASSDLHRAGMRFLLAHSQF